jgi:hypothetical protein
MQVLKATSLVGNARPAPTRVARRSSRLTKRARILPSFLVIGAQRAGTTSFFSNLCEHPQVARPIEKELHFFNYDYWRGADWYRSFFPTAAAQRLARLSGSDLVGAEATPYYLYHPAVPRRVAETVPDAKLVVLLRNPVDRAYSHYHKMRRMGFEWLSFEKALAVEERRLAGSEELLIADPLYRNQHHRRHSYFARGVYVDQLARWLAYFPRNQLLVLMAEDFFSRPADIYAQTLDFLGLAQHQWADRRVGTPPAYEPLDVSLRASLEQRYLEPNARLARLLGRNVWGSPAASAA